MYKEYLGDAVYAEVSEFGELVLTTEDGITATNTIVLEAEVLDALFKYIDRQQKRSARQKRSASKS